MAEEPDELRHQAIEKREEVADDLIRLQLKLQETAHEATDWRRLVRSRPFAFLGAAIGIGTFLGLTLGGYLRVRIPGLTPGASPKPPRGFHIYLPPEVSVRRAR